MKRIIIKDMYIPLSIIHWFNLQK